MYIQINLFLPELLHKKVLFALDYRTVLVLVSIIAAGVLAYYYISIDRDIKAQDEEIKNWKQAEVMLKKSVDLQNEVNKLRADISTRINIIKELTGDSDLRFSILQHINSIIPENLWLLRITERIENDKVIFNIEGMSYSKQNISAFIASLQEYENFNSVSLESIQPAPLEIRDAYQYSVNVEPKFTQVVEQAAPAAGRRPRR